MSLSYFLVVVPDQTIWALCAVFYLSDNIKRLDIRRLILLQNIRGEWLPVFPFAGYRLGGRTFTILNPFLPWCAGIQMDWLSNESSDSRIGRHARRRLSVFLRALQNFGVLSIVLSASLFVVGPLVTHYYGVGYAFRLVLPIHLSGLIVLMAMLLAQRRLWRMSWMKMFNLLFECAICPGYFANVCRRISFDLIEIRGDAIGLSFACCRGESIRSFEHRLLLHAENLEEYGEISDSDKLAIASYRVKFEEISPHTKF